ncbi:MAG: hypothetical protein RLZZ312_1360 [Bacteroidota bacterium]
MYLKGENIFLRALEPIDLDFIYEVENNIDVWEISGTQTPYSKFLIKQYLENAHQDIFEAKQLRLAICEKATEDPLGLIDLFEYDPKNNRAGIGLLIQNKSNRNTGIGSEALKILTDYAFYHLNINQLFANISVENTASLNLFSNFGFEKIGIKKNWNLVNGIYKDEVFLQKLRNQS